MPDHLYDVFASSADRFPERTAIEVQRASQVETFCYDALREMTLAAARRLASRGCRKGDRVAILADNDAWWCAAFLGILRLGAVAVPLDTSYAPGQVATVLADCGARILLVGRRQLGDARRALEDLGGGIDLLPVDDAGRDSASRDAELPAAPAGRSDAAVLLYTSGTTSDPKGVVLTHGNLLAEREAAFRIVTVGETDAVLGVLPLFHALALLANLVLPFSVGARVVFLETVNTSELMRALAEREISCFCCVPQFYYLIHERVMRGISARGAALRLLFRAMLRANGWLRQALRWNVGKTLFRPVHAALGPRMRLLVTGGSRFDPEVGRDLVRLGFDIVQAYGLTECAGAATLTSPGDLEVGHVGRPLPGVEVRIAAREEGGEEEGGGGRDGEILIRGPIVMEGYYRRPDANAVTLRDGWLHTGDLGFLDAKGRLHITGRSKEVIVLASGKNIHPEEIEAHYARSPFVKELCVLGRARPGEPVAERLHAVVVPDLDVMRERKIVNMLEQIRFEIEGLSVGLPSHKRILSYDIRLEELPRTTTRKLKRFAVEREFGSTSEGGGAEPPPHAEADDAEWLEDPFTARVLAVVGEAAKPGARVRASANLELDLGFDSMERIELFVRLERATGVRIPDEAAQRVYTVRDLVETLRRAPRGEGGGGASEEAGAWDRLLAEAPADSPALAALLRRRPVATAALFLFARALRLAARVAIGFRVSGLERLPPSGPFLLSPNHQSYLDAFLLVSALPYRVFRRMFFVGASEYFATSLRLRIARAIHVVPVDPDTNLVRAMQAGAFGLHNGKVLILFPEGERSIDGGVKSFKKGAAILSLHLGVPIVPVAIDGASDVWPRNRPFQWRALLPGSGARVLLEFGAPLAPALERTDYAALTAQLRDAVERGWRRLRERRGGA
jgi:long-chain acyl-CoA synthetase